MVHHSGGEVPGAGKHCAVSGAARAKYGRYKEAWDLLREAIAAKEEEASLVEGPRGPVMERVKASLEFVRRRMEG